MADALDSVPGASRAPGAGLGLMGQTHTRMTAWQTRWRLFAPRERRLMTIAATVLAAFLLYVVAIRPAWVTVRDAPQRLGALESQLQQMQRLAVESKELRGMPRVAPTQAGAALKAATDTLGAVGRLNVVGDRATLTVTNATGEQVRRWLVEARTAARARPVEATLSRSGDQYSGSVIVALPTLQ